MRCRRQRWSKAICVAAQALLLTVCAVSFVVMSGWNRLTLLPSTGGEEKAENLVADVGNGTADSNEVAPSPEGSMQSPRGDVLSADDLTAVAPADETALYRAEQRLSLDERVAQLLSESSLRHDGETHYGELLEKSTVWSVPKVLIRFDELAAIYMAALREAAPKVKDGKLQSVQVTVDGDTITMTMKISFNVTNQLLKLFVGGGEQTIDVKLIAKRQGEGMSISSIEAKGNKKYSENTVKLASDFLFGTEDYMAFVGEIARQVTASLGKVQAVDEVRYGVIFQTAVKS